jgi:hypothetical protein
MVKPLLFKKRLEFQPYKICKVHACLSQVFGNMVGWGKVTPTDPMPMGGVLGLSEPYVHSADFVMQTRCQEKAPTDQ